MEFKAFPSIVRLYSQISITEKIHGTNAQISIFEYTSTNGEAHELRLQIKAGSRTRWLTPDDDNYGFAAWVEANREDLIAKLGPGIHFGEWFGSGINGGYELKEKRLALFDVRWAGKDLPAGVTVVPLLYQGPWTDDVINEVMLQLKVEGSKAVPGYQKPEGVVIRFDRNGATFKAVFEAEETGWKAGPPKPATVAPASPEVLALLQPIRLEKVLSRDERFVRSYPETLPEIVREYVADLEKEGGLDGVSKPVLKAMKGELFPWVKAVLATMGLRA